MTETRDEQKTIYPIHSTATLFPMMSQEELQGLADDIRANGLREPIAIWEGQILDGRNRVKACELAGVEPQYIEACLPSGSPSLFVAEKNLLRRHLTSSQRAAIGALMMPMIRKEAKERQRKAGRENGNHPLPVNLPEAAPNPLRGDSRDIAAKAVGSNGKSVQSAAAVLQRDPELFERIKQGEIGVDAAYRQVTNKPEIVIGTQKQKWAKAETERMILGVSQIRGLCRGLDELKMDRLILTPEERATWKAICLECIRSLRSFARKVRADETPSDQI